MPSPSRFLRSAFPKPVPVARKLREIHQIGARSHTLSHGLLIFAGRTCMGLSLCGEPCRAHDARVPLGAHDRVQGKAWVGQHERSAHGNGANDPQSGAMCSTLSLQWSATVPTSAPGGHRAFLTLFVTPRVYTERRSDNGLH